MRLQAELVLWRRVFLLIDRASQNITFYLSDGRVHCDHIDALLEKFHSTNFAQAVKLNEIFNLYCVRRGLLL